MAYVAPSSQVLEDEYARPSPLKGIPKTPIVLFQYEVCPFCCKAKAALDFYKARRQGRHGRLHSVGCPRKAVLLK